MDRYVVESWSTGPQFVFTYDEAVALADKTPDFAGIALVTSPDKIEKMRHFKPILA